MSRRPRRNFKPPGKAIPGTKNRHTFAHECLQLSTLDDPKLAPITDPYVLVEWPITVDQPVRAYDVFPRSALQDGTLRVTPQHMLTGTKAMIMWKTGKIAEGLIIMTGTVALVTCKYNLKVPYSYCKGTRDAMNQRRDFEIAKEKALEETNAHLRAQALREAEEKGIQNVFVLVPSPIIFVQSEKHNVLVTMRLSTSIATPENYFD